MSRADTGSSECRHVSCGRALRRQQADRKAFASAGQGPGFDARRKRRGVHGQARQHRQAQACRHHLHQGRHAVGFGPDARTHGRLLHQHVQVLPVAAAGHGRDQGECRQRVGGHGLCGGKLMAGGHHDDRHVARDEPRPKLGVAGRPAVNQAHVSRAVAHGLHRVGGVPFLDGDLGRRISLRKLQQHRRKEAGAKRLRRRDADRAWGFADVVADRAHGIVGQRKEFTGPHCQPLARGGQRKPVIAAHEQRLSEAVFKRLHLFGDGGLGQMHLRGGLGEAQGLGSREKGLQVP